MSSFALVVLIFNASIFDSTKVLALLAQPFILCFPFALINSAFGANFFFLPNNNQKLEASISNLYEYRYGGEMIDKAAHLTQQSEERIHHVLMGGLDYQINFNDDESSLITYVARIF